MSCFWGLPRVCDVGWLTTKVFETSSSSSSANLSHTSSVSVKTKKYLSKHSGSFKTRLSSVLNFVKLRQNVYLLMLGCRGRQAGGWADRRTAGRTGLIPIFWDMMLHHWVHIYRRFEVTCRLHFQGFEIQEKLYFFFIFRNTCSQVPTVFCHVEDDRNPWYCKPLTTRAFSLTSYRTPNRPENNYQFCYLPLDSWLSILVNKKWIIIFFDAKINIFSSIKIPTRMKK